MNFAATATEANIIVATIVPVYLMLVFIALRFVPSQLPMGVKMTERQNAGAELAEKAHRKLAQRLAPLGVIGLTALIVVLFIPAMILKFVSVLAARA